MGGCHGSVFQSSGGFAGRRGPAAGARPALSAGASVVVHGPGVAERGQILPRYHHLPGPAPGAPQSSLPGESETGSGSEHVADGAPIRGHRGPRTGVSPPCQGVAAGGRGGRKAGDRPRRQDAARQLRPHQRPQGGADVDGVRLGFGDPPGAHRNRRQVERDPRRTADDPRAGADRRRVHRRCHALSKKPSRPPAIPETS